MCLAQGHAGRRSWGTAAPTASQVGRGGADTAAFFCCRAKPRHLCRHRYRLPSEIICDRLGQLRSADLHRPARECAHRGCGAAGRQPAALPGGAGCIPSGGARRAGALPASVVPCCFASNSEIAELQPRWHHNMECCPLHVRFQAVRDVSMGSCNAVARPAMPSPPACAALHIGSPAHRRPLRHSAQPAVALHQN